MESPERLPHIAFSDALSTGDMSIVGADICGANSNSPRGVSVPCLSVMGEFHDRA
jgi:hypothetical protein